LLIIDAPREFSLYFDIRFLLAIYYIYSSMDRTKMFIFSTKSIILTMGK